MSTAAGTQSKNTFDPNQTFLLVKLDNVAEVHQFKAVDVVGPASGFEIQSEKGEKIQFSYAVPVDVGSVVFNYPTDPSGNEITYFSTDGKTYSVPYSGRLQVTVKGLTHEGELTAVRIGTAEKSALFNGKFVITFAK